MSGRVFASVSLRRGLIVLSSLTVFCGSCYVGLDEPAETDVPSELVVRLSQVRRYDPDRWDPPHGDFARAVALGRFTLPEIVEPVEGNAGEGWLTVYFIPGRGAAAHCRYLGNPATGAYEFDACAVPNDFVGLDELMLDVVPGEQLEAELLGLLVHSASTDTTTDVRLELTGVPVVRE